MEPSTQLTLLVADLERGDVESAARRLLTLERLGVVLNLRIVPGLTRRQARILNAARRALPRDAEKGGPR